MSRNEGITVWPEAISAHAQSVDALALSFFALIVALAAPIGICIVWFGWRYRRLNDAVDRTRRGGDPHWIEWAWMFIPFGLALAFFVWSALLLRDTYRPPGDAHEIYGVGLQWMWKFEHPGGQREINTLHVPAGEPVRLVLSSQDVVHSLYLPQLRIKRDVVPGRTSSLWFQADRTGRYRLTCAEFCGLEHARMGGELVVLSPEDFSDWLAGAEAGQPLAERGATLYRELGCSGCHEPGSAVRAPSLDGLYGRPVPLASGTTVIADERYLTDAIRLPESEITAGYEPVMPSFADIVSEEELVALLAFIRSRGAEDAGGAADDE